MDDLKPCPFCGESAYDDNASCAIFGARTGHNYAVACRNCEVSGPGSPTLAGAIETWNTRATPTVQEAAKVLLDKFENPFDHPDMNTGEIDWQNIWNLFWEDASQNDAPAALMAVLRALSEEPQ